MTDYTPHPEAIGIAMNAFLHLDNCQEAMAAALTAYNQWMAEHPRELTNKEIDSLRGLNYQDVFNQCFRLVFIRQPSVPKEIEEFYASKGKDFSAASDSEQEMAVALFNLGRSTK